jgi:hypothetical protein
MHPDGVWIPIVLFVSMAATAIGVPIARAIGRRMDREPIAPLIPHELAAQIERMEHAIDSIAIEVERISEGQRFTTKLLAERNNGGGSGASSTQASGKAT